MPARPRRRPRAHDRHPRRLRASARPARLDRGARARSARSTAASSSTAWPTTSVGSTCRSCIRAPADALGAVDVIWYVRGKLAFLFEVEWTAMVGEAVLQRGREHSRRGAAGALPGHPRRARRSCFGSSSSGHRGFAPRWSARTGTSSSGSTSRPLPRRPGARIEWLEPVLGLDPLIERGGEQLTMFGE